MPKTQNGNFHALELRWPAVPAEPLVGLWTAVKLLALHVQPLFTQIKRRLKFQFWARWLLHRYSKRLRLNAGSCLATPRLFVRGVQIRERGPYPLADLDRGSISASGFGPGGPNLGGSKSAGTPAQKGAVQAKECLHSALIVYCSVTGRTRNFSVIEILAGRVEIISFSGQFHLRSGNS